MILDQKLTGSTAGGCTYCFGHADLAFSAITPASKSNSTIKVFTHLVFMLLPVCPFVSFCCCRSCHAGLVFSAITPSSKIEEPNKGFHIFRFHVIACLSYWFLFVVAVVFVLVFTSSL